MLLSEPNTNSLTTDSYTDSLSVRWNWISVWNFCFRGKLRITSTSRVFITITVHIKSNFLGPVYTWHKHILGYLISGHLWVQEWMHPRCCEDTLRSDCFDHIHEVVCATYGYIIFCSVYVKVSLNMLKGHHFLLISIWVHIHSRISSRCR